MNINEAKYSNERFNVKNQSLGKIAQDHQTTQNPRQSVAVQNSNSGLRRLRRETIIPLLTVVFGHVLVLTPTLFALASHIGKKKGYDSLARQADEIDSYVQRFAKGINIAIYTLVTLSVPGPPTSGSSLK